MKPSFKPLAAAEKQWVDDQLGRATEFVRTFSGRKNVGSLTLESLDQAFEKYLESRADPSTAAASAMLKTTDCGRR